MRPLVRSTILTKGIALILLACVPGAEADEVPDLSKFNTLKDVDELIYDQKYDAALDRLRPLAAAGNPEAEFTLGTMLESGLGVPKSVSGALVLYQRSADAGYPFAQKKIGLFDFSVKQYDQAFAILRPLAQMGFRGNVSGALAGMYRYGLGTPVDEAKAKCWMRKTIQPVLKSFQGSC